LRGHGGGADGEAGPVGSTAAAAIGEREEAVGTPDDVGVSGRTHYWRSNDAKTTHEALLRNLGRTF
jgi:hypothetical protein